MAKSPAVIDDGGYDSTERVSMVGTSQSLAPRQYDGTQVKAFRFEVSGKYTLEFLGEAGVPKAYRGAVRLRAYGASNEARLENIRAAAKAAGLEPLLEKPDSAFTQKVVAQAVLRHKNAPVADALLLKLGAASLDDVKQSALANGADEDRLARAKLVEVFPGHAAVLDPLLGEEYASYGVKGVFVGVREVESVARILKSDGLMSYTERVGRGLFRPGASNAADEASGGARAAFARAVTPSAMKIGAHIGASYGAGAVQLLSTGAPMRRLLSRTDWYGYQSDMYGVSIREDEAAQESVLMGSARNGAYSKRPVGKALVDAINGSGGSVFSVSNELCFDSGIGNVWTHAIVPSPQARAGLIATLEKVGIHDLNGLPFDKAILVAQTWAQVRDGLVAQGIQDWTS
jgi:hypothetical protein